MSPTDDWNHMVLVESNSSCDNIARNSPPTQSLTLSHVTVIQERLQLEKVNRWLGPRTKWSWFSKSTCGIWGGNGFAAKQSITHNYNNSTLEDGLFHFIMRFALSCLMVVMWWWWWWGGGIVIRDRDYVKQILGPLSECFHLFLLCPARIELMDDYFSSNACHNPYYRRTGHRRLTILNISNNW